MAAPAVEAGRLLGRLVGPHGGPYPEMAVITASIQSASLVVLNVGFRRSDIGHPLQGFGFLVPQNEPEFPLMGVLWADSIFPHHAPPDHRLIRVFIGGARDPDAVSRSDDDLLETAMNSLRGLLQLSGDPVLVDVCRYPAAIPQYHVGHAEKIARLRTVVATKPGLHLVGNYLDGVSLNDCVRTAKLLDEQLLHDLRKGDEGDAAPSASRGLEASAAPRFQECCTTAHGHVDHPNATIE